MSDYKGAALILSALPAAKELLGDRGYDADGFRKALDERCITACIPGRSNRGIPISYDRDSIANGIKLKTCSGAQRLAAHPHPL